MKIFFSYPHSHSDLAEDLVARLRAQGHEVFQDRSSLPPGQSYDDRIREQIQQSSLFLILVTADSLRKGSYSRTELGYAEAIWPNPSGHVLPVIIEPEAMDTLPAYLKAVTVLQPQGQITADVIAAVNAENKRSFRRVNTAGRWAAAAIIAFALFYLAYVMWPKNPVTLLVEGSGATYEASVDGKTQVLSAASEYLKELEGAHTGQEFVSGEKLSSLLEADTETNFGQDTSPLPTIQLGIVNNSNRIVVLDRIRISVENSYVDEQPLIATGTQGAGSFWLNNSGWSDMRDIHFRFNLVEQDEVENFQAPAVWQFTRKIADIPSEEIQEISLMQEHADLGLVDNEKPALDDSDLTDGILEQFLSGELYEASNTFHTGGLYAVGELEYTYGSEEPTTRTLHIYQRIPLGTDYSTGAGFNRPDGKYQMLLQPDQSSYVWEVAISRHISPGSTDSLEVTLFGEKSSHQNLQVSVQADNEWVDAADTLQVHYYRPANASWGDDFNALSLSEKALHRELMSDLDNYTGHFEIDETQVEISREGDKLTFVFRIPGEQTDSGPTNSNYSMAVTAIGGGWFEADNADADDRGRKRLVLVEFILTEGEIAGLAYSAEGSSRIEMQKVSPLQ